jgi:hypothetical protein
MVRKLPKGQKPSITTLAIRKGLICPVDGQIFSDNLLEDITSLIIENGYSMKPEVAVEKIEIFCAWKDEQAYG